MKNPAHSRAFHITAAAALLASARLLAMPPELVRAVPADAIAAHLVAGPTASETAERLSVMSWASLLDRAYDMGILSQVDSDVRPTLDVLAAVSQCLSYPHALVLTDVRAEPRPGGGHQLAGLSAGLILYSRGHHTPIERRIQHLLASYTNSDDTTLEQTVPPEVEATGGPGSNVPAFQAGNTWRFHEGAAPYPTLKDRRLPSWAQLRWGRVDDWYVLTIGDSIFEQITATIGHRSPSLADDAWTIEAYNAIGGDAVSFAWFLRFDRLSDLFDSHLSQKINDVKVAVGLGGAERAVAAVRRNGRLVEATIRLLRDDRNEQRMIARDAAVTLHGASTLPRFYRCNRRTTSPTFWRDRRRAGDLRSMIPQAATYTMIDSHPRAIVNAMSDAYLAGRGPASQRKIRAFWRDFERRASVSLDRDILAQFDRGVVVFDDPDHAIGLLPDWTILIPVRADANDPQRRIDQWLDCLARWLADESVLRLQRDQDGIWCLQLGLSGPSLGLTPHWLIISFCPDAVRRNQRLLAEHPRSPS